MSRERGAGYIPDKSNLMSSTLVMLNFFRDGEKSFSRFSAFLESNYNIKSANTVRMTLVTLCKWKLLRETDFKTYSLTDAGINLLNTPSEILLGKHIQACTLYFAEILQELETEAGVLTGSTLKQIGNQKYGMPFKATSDLSCRTQYLVGLGFVEKTAKKYKITPQGRDFLQLLRDEKLLSENNVESNEYISLKLTGDFVRKCERKKIAPECALRKLMTYYTDNELF